MLLALIPLVFVTMLGVVVSRSRARARAEARRDAGQADYIEALEAGARAASAAEAAERFERAADLALAHFGRISHQRARALDRAAVARAALGETGMALSRLEGAIAIERQIGADPLALAAALERLAALHPNHDAAYRAATEALALIRRAGGRGDARYRRTARRAAALFGRIGHGAEAEALYRALLAEPEAGADTAESAALRAEFAAFLEAAGRPDAAARLRAEG